MIEKDIVQELRDYEAQDMAKGNAETIEDLMKRAADEIELLRIIAQSEFIND